MLLDENRGKRLFESRGILRLKNMEEKKIMLDACCGSRMFWFDKQNPLAEFMDIRDENHILSDGRKLDINPTTVGDFTNMPFPDKQFKLIIFDPPHMESLGENSWMRLKYGKLYDGWRDDFRKGFSECFRVLDDYGVLIFKWNSIEVPVSEILKLTDQKPIIGHKSGKRSDTHWLTFMKIPS